MRYKNTLAALLCLLLASCASIVAGGPDFVAVSSAPQGAEVFHEGMAVGVTPCTLAINRGTSSDVTLRLNGHHEQLVELGSSLNPWVVGNVIFGGILGILIDIASDNAMRVDTLPAHVPLIMLAEAKPSAWKRPKRARGVRKQRRADSGVNWSLRNR